MKDQDIINADITDMPDDVVQPEDIVSTPVDVSVEDVEKMQEDIEQKAHRDALLQLAVNVANIMLNETDFLKRVVRHTATTLISTNAAMKQGLERPYYVVTRDMEPNNYTFTVEVTSIDQQDPFKSKFRFTFLKPDQDREEPESWETLPNLHPEIKALILGQLFDLQAKPGERFYGRVYKTELTPEQKRDPIDALSKGQEPDIALSDSPAEGEQELASSVNQADTNA